MWISNGGASSRRLRVRQHCSAHSPAANIPPHAGIASVYTVFAKTPAVDGGERQMTAFIVTRDPSDASGKSGVRPGPPEKKLGIRGSNTCVVNFDNAYVPDDQVRGCRRCTLLPPPLLLSPRPRSHLLPRCRCWARWAVGSR